MLSSISPHALWAAATLGCTGIAWAEIPEHPLDSDRMIADLQQLSGADPVDGGLIESRYILHPHHNRATEWLRAQLEDIKGMSVQRHAFSTMDVQLDNLVAKRRGRNRSLAPIILAAHYDSIASFESEGSWDGATDPAPGADDDGSGVVAVLELARLFSQRQYKTNHPLWFVLFTAEEVGLVGSTEYVKQLGEDGQDVALMLALDPIGFNPAGEYHLWYAYNSQWTEPADALDRVALARQGPLTVHGIDEALMGGDERSDHFPFWQAGFPALHLANFPLSPNYHTLEDRAEDVDPLYLTSTTELVADLVMDIDGRSEAPGLCQVVQPPRWGATLMGLMCLVWHRRRFSAPLKRR